MNTKSFLNRFLGTLTAVALISGTAVADTESFSYTIPDTLLSVSSVLNSNFNLAAFDPSLGTLTGVTLTLDLTTVASPQVVILSGTSGTYTNTATSFYSTFTGPDGSYSVYKAVSTTDAGSVTGTVGTTTTLTGSPVVSSTSSSVLAANFGSYQGTTPLSFKFTSPGATAFSSGGTATSGHLGFGGSGEISGAATIQYTFTAAAAPEPSAWILGAICVVAFASLRSRAKSRNC